jgi:hypothetical protein
MGSVPVASISACLLRALYGPLQRLSLASVPGSLRTASRSQDFPPFPQHVVGGQLTGERWSNHRWRRPVGMPVVERRVGWQPARFLADRAEPRTRLPARRAAGQYQCRRGPGWTPPGRRCARPSPATGWHASAQPPGGPPARHRRCPPAVGRESMEALLQFESGGGTMLVEWPMTSRASSGLHESMTLWSRRERAWKAHWIRSGRGQGIALRRRWTWKPAGQSAPGDGAKGEPR